ncbi:(Citrate (pro-3S)-lyase) ligase [Clostridiaceae bacterium BL-3]|nr:(Citrate (pro-3S)-lyase) ligase [Clostridiaceae bacterium BL-3]
MQDLIIQRVDLESRKEREEVDNFLKKFDLCLDDDVDYTIALRDIDKNIKATCSKSRNIFKCFAVSEDIRGENVTSSLVSHLIDKSFEGHFFHDFIFTKLNKVDIFKSLNFKMVYEVEDAALLEYGIYDINQALDYIALKYSVDTSTPKGALVMNCNPFTEGHRFLVEKAAANCPQVLLFIVQEDRSVFPFECRYDIAKKATNDLKNVIVIPGGEYIISSVTFPSYFIKEENIRLKAYEDMDCGIFGKYFCSKFNIVKRFAGQEPYCKITNMYNKRLKEIMPKYGVQFIEIERKKYGDEYISASKVRELIRKGNIEEVKKIVPEATWEFLNSYEGKKVIGKIREN